MVEREDQEIELTRNDFREIPKGPLGKPKDLWFVVVVWTLGAALSAFAGWQIGGFWAALMPIPAAMWAGVGIAGLFPAWFFGKPD